MLILPCGEAVLLVVALWKFWEAAHVVKAFWPYDKGRDLHLTGKKCLQENTGVCEGISGPRCSQNKDKGEFPTYCGKECICTVSTSMFVLRGEWIFK